MCGECGDWGECSESCGARGSQEGGKDCWLVSGVTGEEIPSSRHSVPCTQHCETPCPTEECGECGDWGECSESCGARGSQEGGKECWMVSGVTGEEIPSSRRSVTCTQHCETPCPTEECGECGDWGECSESCGARGSQEGGKECWMVSGVTGEEIPDSRHVVTCTQHCETPCPTEECGECGDWGECSESCGARGSQEGGKECWMVSGVTGEEIPDSRHVVTCTQHCETPCPTEECGECGDWGECSESCGARGSQEGGKECWMVSGVTGEEIPSSRHVVTCTQHCETPCPTEECGECGDWGECSESCGARGSQEGGKECWMVSGVTGEEIPSSRHSVTCTKHCETTCPTTTTEATTTTEPTTTTTPCNVYYSYSCFMYLNTFSVSMVCYYNA